jgi:hypothetical protein
VVDFIEVGVKLGACSFDQRDGPHRGATLFREFYQAIQVLA